MWTDAQTDRQTDRQGDSYIPKFVCGGINMQELEGDIQAEFSLVIKGNKLFIN